MRRQRLVPVHAPGAQARHEDAAPAERDFAARAPAAIRAALGVGNMLRAAKLRAILFHHRAQHLLARVEAEAAERGARVGEHIERRQRQLHGGHGRTRALLRRTILCDPSASALGPLCTLR